MLCNVSYWMFRVDYVQRYATEVALRELEQGSDNSDEESSISDFSSEDETQDMEL